MIPPSSSPSPSPSPSPISDFAASVVGVQQSPSPPLPVDFSPPLIAMVVVVAAAFLVVTYSRLISRHVAPPLLRLIRRRHQASSSAADLDSLPYYDSPSAFSDGFHVISPYGLDDSVIKTIPLSVYTKTRRVSSGGGGWINDCAVCLIEFDEDDYVRTLPACSHAFHVDCIDIWLRSHANCPLCRAGILRPPHSPFVPLMAARIRPSLDEALLRTIELETPSAPEIDEIDEIPPPRRRDHDFLLKRSYSFGFERSAAASERMMMVMEANAMTTPWRRAGGGGFWSKRPSPFGSLPKPRVFSFRYYRGMKSPAFFRRGRGFFPLSESSSRFSGGGGSSRRTRSMTSPMFMRRSSVSGSAAAFSSSRLRCGDPEALLSPERFNGR